MGKKIYAIKEGFDKLNNKKIENVIVNSWEECLKFVNGVKGAKYKSFENLEDAYAFLNTKNDILKKGLDKYPEHALHAYVDGSFNQATGKYSYGLVVVKDNIILHIENGSALDNSKQNLRQIAGELEAAIKAVQYALNINEKELVIFHDYEGICYHATGYWERKDQSSKDYYSEFNRLSKEGQINVTFVKVDSHTGDLFNEIADEEAKYAAGIKLDKITEKWLSTNCITVINEDVKRKLLEIVSDEAIKNVSPMTNSSEPAKSIKEIIFELNRIIQIDKHDAERFVEGLSDSIKNEIILALVSK